MDALPPELRARRRAASSSARWVTPALLGVGGLAALLYLWNLTVSGYGNTYYAMAAQAASQDWTAFFYGSLDAGSFITLDKPPLATWVMGLSVRLFGLSPASVLVPQALAGVATVLVVFAAARRSFGPAAGIIAALATALTPAAVLIFRYDNPDAILTLLLVAAAYALVRALEAGSWRWVLLAAALVGAGFTAKYLQAWMVLPSFALAYVVAAPGGLGRRLAQLAAAAATVLATSLWWVGIVEAVPAGERPYIGGSETNSALDLLLGYDGLGRLVGQAPGGVGMGPTSSPFGGEAGTLRLLNEQFGGQVGWLVPLALVALATGLWLTRRAPRTDARRAGYLLWGGWLLTHAAVFSFMSGIIHPYYSVVLAPAIGALVGGGLVDLWGWRARSVAGGLVLGTAVAVTGLLAAVLLARTPDFVPWLGPIVAVGGVIAGVVLAAPAGRVPGRVAVAAAGLALLVALAGPAAYAGATIDRALDGGDPQPGPASATAGRLGDAGPGGLPGGPAGRGDGASAPGGAAPGDRPAALPGDGVAPGDGIGRPGAGAMGGGTLDEATLDYLVASRGDATWLLAVPSANIAGPIQLATGVPVMAMGGFSGADPAPTLEELQRHVRSGALRFVMTGGFAGPGPGGARGSSDVSSAIADWVAAACEPIAVDGSPSGSAAGASGAAGTIHDCAGAG